MKYKECNVVCTMHKMHCSSACLLKLHIRDGKIVKITSAGDIPRENSWKSDNSIAPIQRRACARGYAELNHLYSPDRVKYPLKQTIERGNPRGFKRITWDEAIETIAQWYRSMEVRKDELGYYPILDKGGITPYLGTCISTFGNPSGGNVNGAIHVALGDKGKVKGNSPMDIFNSKYIIVWSNDPTATLPYLSYILIKAKENGIPITFVDARYTESIGALATGKNGVPGFILVRPGTDGALMAAMAYIIYKRNLHDEEFIKEYCFGFYPNDTVTSHSTGFDPVTDEPYKGKTYKIPKGESFIEYLETLEKENGSYEGVLKWASCITGVPIEVIEKFAIEYATVKPSFIFSKYNGGAQRTHNGLYYSWMMIALSAMTGNINKRGGGFGELRGDDGYEVKFPQFEKYKSAKKYKPILVSQFALNDAIISGLDGRTSAQLREDVLNMNSIDLGENARLYIEAYIRGDTSGNIFNQTQNINKRRIAWSKLKHIVSYERNLSPTAMWSDIVLPFQSIFENRCNFEKHSSAVSDVFVLNGPVDAMFEAKPDAEINRLIAKKLNIDGFEINTDYISFMKYQWSKAEINPEYKEINSDIKLPDFDEIIREANFQLPVPKEKLPIVLGDFKPGEFTTETGRINFYSPFLAQRGRAVLKINKAQYVPLANGAEKVILDGGVTGRKGIKYRLQFITPHPFNKANATYDNVPTLRNLKPHSVEMHPEDAKIRNIDNGDMVYVYNDYGCVKLPARITATVSPDVVVIPQGSWYRPSLSETYEAYFDSDCDGIAEKHIVPVDVGGCVNTLTEDLNSGILDPYIDGLGLNAGGALCEVSKEKPI
ncbi:molybdopterin-dependent oxidoreductase [Lutispora sp.]|uniref:molybdopterin-containing oxidoreductase family protein n=1 Tax=Lutispora sp. TaxID=2828727 RepID=UPI003565753B